MYIIMNLRISVYFITIQTLSTTEIGNSCVCTRNTILHFYTAVWPWREEATADAQLGDHDPENIQGVETTNTVSTDEAQSDCHICQVQRLPGRLPW